tara:strand:+ start:379 stop:1692 length:1314 start_codon:yes stop_codon:yes gene_type:complete
MSLPAFVGKTRTILWNNETIPTAGNGFPPRPNGYRFFGNQIYVKSFFPLSSSSASSVIQWEGTVPSVLQGLRLSEIQNLSVDNNFAITVLFDFKIIQGNQQHGPSATPNINFNIYNNDGTIQLAATNIAALEPLAATGFVSYPFGGQSPNFPFSPLLENIPPSYILQGVAWNNASLEVNWPGLNMTIVADMTVTLRASCQTGPELESAFCLNYCTQNSSNLQFCQPQYINYCLNNPTSAGDINIFTSTPCQTFIQDYISVLGPRAELDIPLGIACQRKFTDVDSFRTGTGIEQKVCGCHLDPAIYQRLKASLDAEFPGYQAIDINAACLFPECLISPYKTQSTTAVCQVPNCINLASITNNGTIRGGTTINQGATGCANIANNTNNNPHSPNPPVAATSWLEKHWVWLVLGISILVILIIVILIVLASENKKKKPKI